MSARVHQLPRTRVLFSAPIDIELNRPKPPGRGDDWTHPQIQEYLLSAREAGFAEGTVVVHKRFSFHERKMPKNWGVIVDVKRYRTASEAYVPFTVKCVGDSAAWHVWHDELLYVHRAVEWAGYDAIFKPQLET